MDLLVRHPPGYARTRVTEICDGLQQLIVLHLPDSAWVPTVMLWVEHGPVPGFRVSQVQVPNQVVNLGIFSLVFHVLSVQSGPQVLSHGGLLCSQEGWFEEKKYLMRSLICNNFIMFLISFDPLRPFHHFTKAIANPMTIIKVTIISSRSKALVGSSKG